LGVSKAEVELHYGEHTLSNTKGGLNDAWNYVSRYVEKEYLQRVFKVVQDYKNDGIVLSVHGKGKYRFVHFRKFCNILYHFSCSFFPVIPFFAADSPESARLIGVYSSVMSQRPCRLCLSERDSLLDTETNPGFRDHNYSRIAIEEAQQCRFDWWNKGSNPRIKELLNGMKSASLIAQSVSLNI